MVIGVQDSKTCFAVCWISQWVIVSDPLELDIGPTPYEKILCRYRSNRHKIDLKSSKPREMEKEVLALQWDDTVLLDLTRQAECMAACDDEKYIFL